MYPAAPLFCYTHEARYEARRWVLPAKLLKGP